MSKSGNRKTKLGARDAVLCRKSLAQPPTVKRPAGVRRLRVDYGEQFATAWVKLHPAMPCVREHRFHPVRMWRFDVAWPEAKLAVEIDGGRWINGRHSRGTAELEKGNAAIAAGWYVLHYTPQDVKAFCQLKSMAMADDIATVIRERCEK